MTMHLRRLACVVAAGTAACMAIAAPAAHADSKNWHKTLSDFALGPFNLAIGHNNEVYVADGFTNSLGIVGQAPFAFGPEDGDIAGVDVTPDGKTVAWAWSNADHSATGLTMRTRGRPDVVADIADLEGSLNPDKVNTYGVTDYGPGADAAKKACVNGIFGELTGAPTYTGMLDSHPYSVARAGNRWVVADAGSNNLWSVTDKGAVTNLTVLPPQPVTFTSQMAAALAEMFGMSPADTECLAGATYAFEPVPTDVEVAPDGSLWVTVLPGGVESPIFGANGSVYKVNPNTGQASLVSRGFLGATNLAVAPDGTVYVTELFGGKVSKLTRNGAIGTVAEVPNAVSVEVHGGYLYVGTMADIDFETGQMNGPGSIMRLKR
jgi:hypothetical protein